MGTMTQSASLQYVRTNKKPSEQINHQTVTSNDHYSIEIKFPSELLFQDYPQSLILRLSQKPYIPQTL